MTALINIKYFDTNFTHPNRTFNYNDNKLNIAWTLLNDYQFTSSQYQGCNQQSWHKVVNNTSPPVYLIFLYSYVPIEYVWNYIKWLLLCFMRSPLRGYIFLWILRACIFFQKTFARRREIFLSTAKRSRIGKVYYFYVFCVNNLCALRKKEGIY